jgi:hypothetical protein
VSELVHCNPFTAHRIELERRALGSEFVEADAEWNLHPQSRHNHPNLHVLRGGWRRPASACGCGW